MSEDIYVWVGAGLITMSQRFHQAFQDGYARYQAETYGMDASMVDDAYIVSLLKGGNAQDSKHHAEDIGFLTGWLIAFLGLEPEEPQASPIRIINE